MSLDWFVPAVRFSLDYLVTDFGFDAPIVEDRWPIALSVTYLGPVAVQALVEPREDYLSIEVLPLVGGRLPTFPPITHLPVERIVEARDPSSRLRDQSRPALNDIEGPVFVAEAAGDLRTYGADLLRGDLSLVPIIREALKDVPGTPGVAWWVS